MRSDSLVISGECNVAEKRHTCRRDSLPTALCNTMNEQRETQKTAKSMHKQRRFSRRIGGNLGDGVKRGHDNRDVLRVRHAIRLINDQNAHTAQVQLARLHKQITRSSSKKRAC